MPQTACTSELKFLASVAMTAPWLKPPTTTPLEQPAPASAHTCEIALVELCGLKAQLDLPEICAQPPNSPLSYSTVAATKPRAAIPSITAVAEALLNVSVVPTKYRNTG